MRCQCRAGCRATVTTQTAERAYASQPDETGRVRTKLDVGSGARLNWLPQQTFLFDRCALSRSLRIEIAADAQLLAVEPLIFGRALMGETLGDVRLRDRIAIRRDGVPLFPDGQDLVGDVSRHMRRACIGQRAGAMATVLYVAADAAALLRPVREGLRSDVLIIDKTDLAPHVGADLAVRARHAKRMHGQRATVFCQVRNGLGVAEVALLAAGLGALDRDAAQ